MNNLKISEKLKNKKVAIVCDRIKDMGGAELVLEHIMEVFPEADIFTSVFWQQNNKIFEGKNVKASFLQKIPVFNKKHKLALFLRPMAFESFDFKDYDIIISSSSAESKGIVTKPDSLHFCYCHTPTRYFWSHFQEYKSMLEFGFFNKIGNLFYEKIIHKLRQIDFTSAQRPDFYFANSENTAKRISKYYKRNSEVLYPGIDLSEFIFSEEKEDFYFYIGRCIPYKKFDLLVEAFNENGKKLIIATNTENSLYKKLKSISKENIIWKLNISRQERNELYSQAKGFLFPPEEDFGLVPVEAMASGTPVIAFGKGGALETVVNNKTGIYFGEQTKESLNKALEEFEEINFDAKEIRKNAEKFSKENFQNNLVKMIEEKIILDF